LHRILFGQLKSSGDAYKALIRWRKIIFKGEILVMSSTKIDCIKRRGLGGAYPPFLLFTLGINSMLATP